MNYGERITIQPGKRGGRRVIRGLCITVYDFLGWLADGMTTEEIIEEILSPRTGTKDATFPGCRYASTDREGDPIRTESHPYAGRQRRAMDGKAVLST